jgi:hypothetical protein
LGLLAGDNVYFDARLLANEMKAIPLGDHHEGSVGRRGRVARRFEIQRPSDGDKS